MNDITIVIPTYWCPPTGKDIFEEKIFDHPIPIDKEDTLNRTLDSLSILKDKNFILTIIVSSTTHKIEDKAIDRVYDITARYKKKYNIKILHYHNLTNLKQKLENENISKEALSLLNLNNYASIRNMCSLACILNDTKINVFIDDDEIFTDENFLTKASKFIGKSINDQKIKAVAGYYIQKDGGYKFDENKVPRWKRKFWNNAKAMNDTFDKIIGKPPRIKITPFVFGGNMVIDKDILVKYPFDPKITRGEDIDFLINLRTAGVNFFLDNQLYIKHLPPSKRQPIWRSFREDIKRFLYERKKILDHSDIEGLSQKDFMPYPGIFLGSDLEDRITKANKLLYEEYKKIGNKEGMKECEKNIEICKNDDFNKMDTKLWLTKLTKNWQELTKAISGKIIDNL